MSSHGRLVLLLLAASLLVAGCRSTTGLEQGQNVRTASSAPTHAPTSTIALPATPTAIAEVEPPSDFGFVFTALSCYRTQLDTFAGTYTRDLVTSAPPVSTTVTLPPQHLRQIYGQMVAIDFFHFPERLVVPLPSDGVVGEQTPSTLYHVVVRQNGTTTTVEWSDNIVQPTTPERQQAQLLASLISQVTAAQPAVRALPDPGIGCA